MVSPTPTQFTTLPPFATRDWQTISKDYTVVFPELEIRDGETVVNALARPLKGENFNWSNLLDTTSVGLPSVSRVLRDSDQTDSGFEITRTSATTITISPGCAMVSGVYFQSYNTETLDLTDSTSFFNPYELVTPDSDFFIIICPVNSSQDRSTDCFGFGFFSKDFYSDYLENHPDVIGLICSLAIVSLNGSGQIQDSDSIRYYDEDLNWNREYLACPPGPPLDPLNGGIIDVGEWYDDWDDIP